MEISVRNDLGPFRVNRFGDRYLINVNRERFDKLGAEVVFDQRFGKSLFNRDTFYIIVGTDSGLLPRYVARKGLPEGSRYLFVDLPEILERIDRESIERIDYATPEQCLESAKSLNLNEYIFIDKVEIVSCCAAEDIFWEAYRDAAKTLRQTVNRYLWEVKSSLGFEAFIRRQLENLGENRVSANILAGLFEGKTAVLLAGGPSLDDIFPWLLAHRDEVVVIAVSRVSRRLLEVGITPDLLVSVDPNPSNFDVSNEMLQFSKTALLVNSYHVCPYVLGQWGGKSVFWGNAFPWNCPLNANTSITMGPTVTNMALDTVVEMGFSQIVLAGVDLCYSREGYTHAQASREHAIGACFMNTDVQVETYGGWRAYTTPAYAMAVGELDGQAQRALQRGCRIFNPAPGAARMSHVRHVDLDHLLLEPIGEAARDRISRVLPPDTTVSRREHYERVLAELERAETALTRIRELSVSALEANARLFNAGGKMNFKYRHRLEKIENSLTGEHGHFSSLVKLFGIPSFIKVSHPDSEKRMKKVELENLGQIYYQAYQDSSERLLLLLGEALCRIEARLEEEQPVPDMHRLARQWRQDAQPGRALVWRERHGDKLDAVGDEGENLLKDIERQFDWLLKKGYIGFTGFGEVEARYHDYFLSGALHRLMAVYQKKDRAELERMIETLAANSSSKAKPLLSLARGYLAELNDPSEEALDHYQEALEAKDEHLQEEALRSIAFLCLKIGATEDALLALEHLSGRSPVYLTMYGDTLKALGMVDQALEVYADYLEKVPEDQAAMLNLGCYYRELGIKEGARLMFTHLLETDPDHLAARMFLAELD